MTAPSRVLLHVRCWNCDRPIELECAGRPGFWGYQTYNAFHCPYCRKLDQRLTPGAVMAAREPRAVSSSRA